MAELIAPTQAVVAPVSLEIAAGASAIVGLICADWPALDAPGAQPDGAVVNIVGAPSTSTPLDLTLDRGTKTRVIPNPTSATITVTISKPATLLALGVFQIGGTPA